MALLPEEKAILEAALQSISQDERALYGEPTFDRKTGEVTFKGRIFDGEVRLEDEAAKISPEQASKLLVEQYPKLAGKSGKLEITVSTPNRTSGYTDPSNPWANVDPETNQAFRATVRDMVVDRSNPNPELQAAFAKLDELDNLPKLSLEEAGAVVKEIDSKFDLKTLRVTAQERVELDPSVVDFENRTGTQMPYFSTPTKEAADAQKILDLRDGVVALIEFAKSSGRDSIPVTPELQGRLDDFKALNSPGTVVTQGAKAETAGVAKDAPLLPDKSATRG